MEKESGFGQEPVFGMYDVGRRRACQDESNEDARRGKAQSGLANVSNVQVYWKEEGMSLADCYNKKTGRILRTPISDAFSAWRKRATKQQSVNIKEKSMLKELWGNPVMPDEIAESRKRTSGGIADWFAEFEKNNEVLVRIVMDSHEFACLRLAMGDEFNSLTGSELIESSRRRNNTHSIKMGVLWTAEVYVTPDLEWVELTGLNGTKIQKLT